MSTTTPRPFCFVLMPFDGSFDDVYELGIAAACKDAGAYAERVDKQIFSESILERIYNQIDKSDILVADMTGRNPNVFYEVGYAHALGKLTILVTQAADDIPFDLKHFPHIVYEGKVSLLKSQLTARIRHFLKHPPSTKSDQQFALDLLYEGKSVLGLPITVGRRNAEQMWLEFTVFNNGTEVLKSDDYEISIITQNERLYVYDVNGERGGFERVRIPDGKWLYIYPECPPLFPGAFRKIAFRFVYVLQNSQDRTASAGRVEPFSVRITTRNFNVDHKMLFQLFPEQKRAEDEY